MKNKMFSIILLTSFALCANNSFAMEASACGNQSAGNSGVPFSVPPAEQNNSSEKNQAESQQPARSGFFKSIISMWKNADTSTKVISGCIAGLAALTVAPMALKSFKVIKVVPKIFKWAQLLTIPVTAVWGVSKFTKPSTINSRYWVMAYGFCKAATDFVGLLFEKARNLISFKGLASRADFQ